MAAYVPIDNVLEAACRAAGVGLELLRDTSRRPRSLKRARAAVAIVAARRTVCSQREIGQALGHADHTTVHLYQRNAAARLEADPVLRVLVREIEAALHQADPLEGVA